jgi:prepilin-type N-terminal cleavage/methylation domain-containing protein
LSADKLNVGTTRQEHTRREAGPQSRESPIVYREMVRLPKVTKRGLLHGLFPTYAFAALPADRSGQPGGLQMRSSFPIHMTNGRFRARRGFTALEMLMVLVVSGMIMAVVAPKFHVARVQASVRSAQEELASYLVRAKSAAIRRGRTARFHVAGNKFWVTVDQGDGTNVPLTGRADLYDQYKVRLNSTEANIIFDARGFATSMASSAELSVTRDGMTQLVCVTRAGAIVRGGCNL